MKKYLRFASALLLMSFPASAHELPSPGVSFSIDIDAPRTLEAGKPANLGILIMSSKNDDLIRADELVRMHDAAFYVIITDETFTDYHYISVQGTGNQNYFKTSFTPKHNGNHYLWADVTPLETSTPVLLPAIIGEDRFPDAETTDFRESVAGNYRFTLKLNRKPSVNRAITGVITISHKDGTALQPNTVTIGEGTHVVGLLYKHLRDSFVMRSSALEASKKAKEAIPAVAFYFTSQHEGYMRVFATFTINGQLVHVPFGITIAPERSGISLDDLNVEMPDIEMPEMPEIDMPAITLPSFEDVNWERILP